MMLYRGVRSRVWRARRDARVGHARRRLANGSALAGKTVVITGGGSGIGFAATSAFARAGASCAVIAIDRAEAEEAIAQLEREGLHVQLAVADVRDPAQVRAAAEAIAARFGAIDVLINNAGVYFPADRETPASRVDPEIVRQTLEVNLFGTMHVCAAFLPFIRSGGRIINVSSMMGRHTSKQDGLSTGYRISKAALNSYTQSLAADLKERGIMVDCFHPGWVKTALGGPDAKIEPHEAVHTAFFLATRDVSTDTGLFWQDCGVVRW